jgi:putative ABC transport system permease protein
LTTKLAQILGVRAGDDVILEALVAPRSVASMRVTSLVDESIGISAYAVREDVNRFMREGPSLSSAQLAVRRNAPRSSTASSSRCRASRPYRYARRCWPA